MLQINFRNWQLEVRGGVGTEIVTRTKTFPCRRSSIFSPHGAGLRLVPRHPSTHTTLLPIRSPGQGGGLLCWTNTLGFGGRRSLSGPGEARRSRPPQTKATAVTDQVFGRCAATLFYLVWPSTDPSEIFRQITGPAQGLLIYTEHRAGLPT